MRIWGARGSLPAPAAANCAFGSDSPCIEVRCGPHVLIFDAGSGAESLGTLLAKEGVKDFDIFLSHCHLDHIIGLPFLKPLYDSEVTARLYAGHFLDDMTCREMAGALHGAAVLPDHARRLSRARRFPRLPPAGEALAASGIAISTVRLNHPNGSVGYRVDYQGRSMCYITDHEHVPGHPDKQLLDMIRGTGILIYDCMYTDAEFDACRGYGHSTWEEGVRLCEAAGIDRLVIFHHRPGRTDDDLRRIEAEAKARFPGAVVAATGLELTP